MTRKILIGLSAALYLAACVAIGVNRSDAQVAISAALNLPVADGTSIVKGSSDGTKQLRFEVDGFTTATTRVATFPNASGTVLLDDGTNVSFLGGATLNGHLGITGTAPTCADDARTTAIDATSTDTLATCNITGDGADTQGVITITFASAYTTAPICTCWTAKGTTGANDASWAVQASCNQSAYSTTAPTFNWINASLAAATTLNSASKYAVNVMCYERS